MKFILLKIDEETKKTLKHLKVEKDATWEELLIAPLIKQVNLEYAENVTKNT